MKGKAMERILVASILCVGVLASSAAGRNLKLTKVGEPDATNIKSLVASVIRGCKSDEEKVIALWGYSTRRPGYYFWDCRDQPEVSTELGYVLDPILRFNVHSGVICFEVQHSLAAMCEQLGLQTRAKDLPGHRVLEVFYDGAWHLFDAATDCASYFHDWDAGGPTRIVSVADVCADPTKYILNQQYPSDPFYPYDHFGGKFIPWETKQYCHDNIYTPGPKSTYEALRAWGHTIDFDLRRGERLIRRWSNQGKWFCPAVLYTTGGYYKMSLGPHNLRNPKDRYVNGELVYQPDWAAHENNFLDGLYQGLNYVLQDGKVGPAGPGDCYVVFRVQSPYHIAGKPGQLNLDGDSHSGAIFEADFRRATVSETNSVAVSTDNGLTWTTVWTNDTTGDRHVKLDLTNQVEGTYGYLIKVRLLADGGVADANMSNMKLTNHLFMSKVPLPAVKPGMNRFQFSMKPAHAVFWIKADMGDAGGYTRFYHELNNLTYSSSYAQHLYPSSGSKAHAVVRVQPPAGWQIQWMSVVGSYGTRGTSDRVQVQYRTDVNPTWVFAWKGGFEGGVHWRAERTQDIYLRQPAGYCDVRFRLKKVSSHLSLNTYRVYAHCTRPEPALPPGMVKVTHSWFADGAARSKTVFPDLGGYSYKIRATGSNIVNRSVIMEVTNEPAPPE